MEVRSFRRLDKNARLTAGVFLFALLGGCALVVPQTSELRDAWPTDLPARIELTGVPFFPQEDYQCGPAALATTLAHSGVNVAPDDLVGQVYLPERRGSLQIEMLAAPRNYRRVSYALAPRFEDLLREVAAGNPVIVLQDYGVWPVHLWHYAVAVGYDRATGEVVLRSGKKPRLTMPLAILEYTWKESAYWAMVTVQADRIPASASESPYLAAIVAMARVGDARAAKIAYAAFLKRWPENLAAGIGLANSHHELGELTEAEALLRNLVERHSDSAVALNNLAQTLSDEGRNEEALAFVERAMEIPGPFTPAARETRELILRRMGRNR